MNYHWKLTKSQSLPNLSVLIVGNQEVGFIYKPRDDKYTKNMWRCHIIIGTNTFFLNHAGSKSYAKKMVEDNYFGDV